MLQFCCATDLLFATLPQERKMSHHPTSQQSSQQPPDDFWLFGYGSLIWKVDFPTTASLPGHIRGYRRRFWQLSEDHRGLPGAPGRVVTLVESDDPEERVWGIAHRVDPQSLAATLQHLDVREKGGYTCLQAQFHPSDSSIAAFPTRIYVGTADNEFYEPSAPDHVIARQIFGSTGPSGPNRDYLFQLADALRAISDEPDPHVSALEREVRRLVDVDIDIESQREHIHLHASIERQRPQSAGSGESTQQILRRSIVEQVVAPGVRASVDVSQVSEIVSNVDAGTEKSKTETHQ